MEMLENVRKALKLCSYDPDPYEDDQPCKVIVSCEICPYWDEKRGCRETDLFNDTLKLLDKLEESETRVLTLEEVNQFVYGTPYIIETNMPGDEPRLMYGLYSHNGIADNFDFATVNERISLLKSDYGMRWRCWTSAPNNEQREATPWRN